MSSNILRRAARTAFVGGVVAGSALVGGTSAAHAAPLAGCGAGWQLKTIAGVVDYIYNASPSVQPYRDAAWWTNTYNTFASFDASAKDADGYLCVKSTGFSPGNDKQYCGRYGYPVCFDYNVTNINDNNSDGRLTA